MAGIHYFLSIHRYQVYLLQFNTAYLGVPFGMPEVDGPPTRYRAMRLMCTKGKTMNSRPLYVVIVGAGLGGLCLAQGLKKHGIAFDVFERDAAPDSRTQGYRIKVDHMGQQSLKACLPEDLFTLFNETSAMPVQGVHVLDTQLRAVAGKWVSSWRRVADMTATDDVADDVNVNRLTLRQTLLCGIEEHVHFGKAYIAYREREDGRVVISFADGSSIVSDVLVAADGVHSKVRQHRLPGANPVDTGSVCIYGKTFASPAALSRISGLLHNTTAIFFGGHLAAVVDAMRFRASPEPLVLNRHARFGISHVDDYLYWAMIGPRVHLGVDESAIPSLSQDNVAALVERISEGWHDGVQALFKMADRASMALMPVWTALPLDAWVQNGITLLGDAIHAMSPAGGLGANTALYDAALLSEYLGKVAKGQCTLGAAIGEYEAAIREQSTRAILASQRGAEVLFGAVSDHAVQT
ncbi:FAD-dependent oxidoreductase [Chitinimonas sp. PSY-7]|uniref:FAD-dependent monooxygenase n=1 Tax=Chitinimonas sp. PSY-7 TaxID=3459088 RepID=UPI00404028DE